MSDNTAIGKAVIASNLLTQLTTTAKEVNAELIQALPKLQGVLETLRRVQAAAARAEQLLAQLNQL